MFLERGENDKYVVCPGLKPTDPQPEETAYDIPRDESSNGHGTCVAAVLGSPGAGVARNAQIISYKLAGDLTKCMPTPQGILKIFDDIVAASHHTKQLCLCRTVRISVLPSAPNDGQTANSRSPSAPRRRRQIH